MAQRHWLDPLARQLLRATGQLPSPARQQRPSPKGDAPGGESTEQESAGHESIAQESIERELLALKLQQNPGLRLEDGAAAQRAAALGWRLDVNRATAADWLRLPGIEPAQVDLLLRLQAGGVQLSGGDDLQRVLELPDARLQAWLPLLEFRWYGTPPVPAEPNPRLNLNQASPRELAQLGLDAERLSRLLRERARGPFSDLADLQARLQLPAAVVESWIGKVQFRAGPAGPVLPPAGKGTASPHR